MAPADRRALATQLGRLARAMGLDETPPAMFFEDARTRRTR
jgi:hypothetical protein